MKGNQLLILGAGVLALILISKSSNAADLSRLNGKFKAEDINRLQRVADALARAGISGNKLKMMLAQILHETGLFSNGYVNYRAVDVLNNYAGISKNGNLKSYNTVDDFVDDYLRVLNLPSHYPIQATDIVDFNNRLKANGYYTDNINTYGNALNYYYNLL